MDSREQAGAVSKRPVPEDASPRIQPRVGRNTFSRAELLRFAGITVESRPLHALSGKVDFECNRDICAPG